MAATAAIFCILIFCFSARARWHKNVLKSTFNLHPPLAVHFKNVPEQNVLRGDPPPCSTLLYRGDSGGIDRHLHNQPYYGRSFHDPL